MRQGVRQAQTVAHGGLGWEEGDVAQRFAPLTRESVTPQAWQALMGSIGQYDVTALLPQVRSPTLVLHRRQLRFPAVDIARGLASRVPDARLGLLEGTSAPPFLGDTEAVLQAIDEFLGEGEKTARDLPSGTAVILFADIVDSTRLTEHLGDAAFRE